MKKLIIAFILFYANLAIGQKAPIKWGKVSKAEAELDVVTYDSSAVAVVLCDYGRIYAEISSGVVFRRHVRIKILDESAKSRADIAIPYYHKDGAEKITSYSAQTINVVNGKFKRTTVPKKGFFKVKRDENISELRFTFPEVQVGSIIEYSYSSESENFTNLESWYFQKDIPTLKSHFFASIGAGLNYNIMYQGQFLIRKYGGKTVNTWELDNLPAIKDEPFCPNPFNYTEKIRFQLASYLTNIGYREVMGDWKSVSKDLYDGAGFRQYLKKNKDASAIVEKIISPEDDAITKVQKIYDHVVNNYRWNGKSVFKFHTLASNRHFCVYTSLQKSSFNKG